MLKAKQPTDLPIKSVIHGCFWPGSVTNRFPRSLASLDNSQWRHDHYQLAEDVCTVVVQPHRYCSPSEVAMFGRRREICCPCEPCIWNEKGKGSIVESFTVLARYLNKQTRRFLSKFRDSIHELSYRQFDKVCRCSSGNSDTLVRLIKKLETKR